jgi:predicted transposase YdaD
MSPDPQPKKAPSTKRSRGRSAGYDNLCKVLAEESPQAWIQWLLAVSPEPEVRLITSELTRSTLRPDFLAEWPESGAMRMLHIEFQVLADSTPPLPLRMFDYAGGCLRRHPQGRLDQVVIVLRPVLAEVLDRFSHQENQWIYRVVKLWEVEPAELLRYPALVPLAVLARSGPDTAAHLHQVASAISCLPKEQQPNAYTAAEVFAGLVFDATLVETILGHESMKESVTYQRIIAKGLLEGEARGAAKGEIKGMLKLVMQALNSRFGALPPPVIGTVQAIEDEAQLRRIMDVCLTGGTLSSVLAAIGPRE